MSIRSSVGHQTCTVKQTDLQTHRANKVRVRTNTDDWSRPFCSDYSLVHIEPRFQPTGGTQDHRYTKGSNGLLPPPTTPNMIIVQGYCPPPTYGNLLTELHDLEKEENSEVIEQLKLSPLSDFPDINLSEFGINSFMSKDDLLMDETIDLADSESVILDMDNEISQDDSIRCSPECSSEVLPSFQSTYSPRFPPKPNTTFSFEEDDLKILDYVNEVVTPSETQYKSELEFVSVFSDSMDSKLSLDPTANISQFSSSSLSSLFPPTKIIDEILSSNDSETFPSDVATLVQLSPSASFGTMIVEEPIAHSSNMVGSTTSTDSSSPPKSAVSSSLESTPHSPEQICAVCGDSAACQHYGVRTCEGCKGFFKRTVQKSSKYTCLGKRDCLVDKRRRNRCQFCRFQKCLSVGMVKEVVRTDNLKGRRGRLPSKCKSPLESPSSPPVSLITSLVKSHLDFCPDPSNIDRSQYCEDKHKILEGKEMASQFLEVLRSCLEINHKFMRKIPGFSDLNTEDQELLLKSASFEIFSLRFAQRINYKSEKFLFCDGVLWSRMQCERAFGDWFQPLLDLSNSLQQMDLDGPAFSCLCALSLISERHGLKEPEKVERLQDKILSSLRDHVTYNPDAQKKPYNFPHILSKLADLRSQSTLGLQRVLNLKLEYLVPVPEIIENLFEPTLPF